MSMSPPLPTPPRLSREERQRQTRQQLLKAASRIIARQGIAAASVRNVAEAAGYSQGAFYSNFADKDALLQTLMEDTLRRQAESFQALIDDTRNDDLAQTLSRLTHWLVEQHADRCTAMLLLELQTHAIHQPAFARQIAPRRAHYFATFVAGITQLRARHHPHSPLDAGQVTAGFVALWHGFNIQLASQYPIDPAPVYRSFLEMALG